MSAVKLTKAQTEALQALGTRGRMYPQKDRTMRSLLRLGFAEYDAPRATWNLTTAGRPALAQGHDNG